MSARKVLFVVHSEAPSPGNVADGLQALGYETVHCCPMLGDALPVLVDGQPEGFAGTVVFGGPQLISKEGGSGYLRDEISWIGEQTRADAPLFGICLGAQMIAASYGAAVGPHPEGVREIGFHEVRSLPAGRDLFPKDGLYYQWHREGFELPPGAVHMATGGDYPNQAFQMGKQVLGIQFHPEMTAKTIETWVTSEVGAPQLSMRGAQAADEQRRLAPVCIPAMRQWLAAFLDSWIGPA